MRTRSPACASRTTRPIPKRASPTAATSLLAVALERALEVVHVADEVGDERRGGAVVDLRRRRELVDLAGVHDGDPVGHRHRLLLVVRDDDERDADVALDALELDLHRLAQLEVERAERLVEQQHLRVHHERARERDALLHAAGELRGLGLLATGQVHQLERLAGLLVALLLADLALLEPVGDVVEHGHVREQRVGLEDRVDVALVRRDADGGAAVDLDLALGRLVEAGDHPQRRRLAAARGPSSARNSPGCTSRSISSTATSSPNRFVTPRSTTSGVTPVSIEPDHTERTARVSSADKRSRPSGQADRAVGTVAARMALHLDLALLLLPLRGE